MATDDLVRLFTLDSRYKGVKVLYVFVSFTEDATFSGAILLKKKTKFLDKFW